MLEGVFHLHEQEARQVMTPTPALVTVNSDDTVEAALRRCISSGHTRLLVIEDDNPDRVRGRRALEPARAGADERGCRTRRSRRSCARR